MNPSNRAVLGISLGTRLIGIAVIKDDSLLHWQVRKFRGAWSPARTDQILEFVAQFVPKHEVRAIAVKVPTRGNLSNGLIDLVSKFGMYASITGIPMKALRIQELKLFFGKRSLNRRQMMQSVCERFPFLERTYHKELANRKIYHLKMFEAILAALWLQERLNKQSNCDQ